MICEMYRVISLELPHRTNLQVFLACIPDKTFVFSVAIMQSSFPLCRHTFTFSFFSLYSFSKQTLFLHAPHAVVVLPSASLADGFSSAALPYDFFRHQDLLNLLAPSLSALLAQQILLVVIFLPSSHFHHYFLKSKQYLV